MAINNKILPIEWPLKIESDLDYTIFYFILLSEDLIV